MKLTDFLPVHSLRGPNIAWFLGAGASASAGVPTALHMVWDFKRTMYAAREKVPLRALSDLGDPGVRLRLDQYFERAGGFPPENSPDEYAYFFEAACATEGDRRLYIQTRVDGAYPSFGHYALAALLKADRIRVVWTTNFDRLVEDAAAQVFGTTGRLVVASLGEPEVGSEAIAEGRWPLLGKLHGDFHSRRLKNVEVDLREQDARMRASLVEICRRSGLAVVGYSGRDESIMDALEEPLHGGHGYPSGLFWFHRADAPLLGRVGHLIERAQSAGVQASVIEIETFDELMSDLLLLENALPAEVLAFLQKKRCSRISNVVLADRVGSWPVLRFNALPVTGWPSTCRLVRCSIGGTAEVRQAISKSGTTVIAARRRAGVICFGSDHDVRRAFSEYDIAELGLYPIEPRRLRYWDSAELGLLYEALGLSLVRGLPLLFYHGRSMHRLVVDPSRADADDFRVLREVLGGLVGTVEASGIRWSEALAIRLEYRLDHLWLLLEPTIWLHREPGATRDEISAEFIRRRLAARYNREWNKILEAWIGVILRGEDVRDTRALGIADGVDAMFTLSKVTAYSRRMPR